MIWYEKIPIYITSHKCSVQRTGFEVHIPEKLRCRLRRMDRGNTERSPSRDREPCGPLSAGLHPRSQHSAGLLDTGLVTESSVDFSATLKEADLLCADRINIYLSLYSSFFFVKYSSGILASGWCPFPHRQTWKAPRELFRHRSNESVSKSGKKTNN